MKYSLIIGCCLVFSLLHGQNILNEIPSSAFKNYSNAFNYTFWDDSFKTSITGPRKFSIQTSSFQLRIDYDNLDIDHLSINEKEQQASLAFAASKAMIFEQQQGGAIDFAILQNGAVLHKKSTKATNFSNKDSQMAEYGTWLNRRFVSVNFDNNPSFETYFTGVEFTNWHNRLKMTLHVRPTVDISNGQLSFSVEIPNAYSQHISDGTIHAFSNDSNAGFALKAGTTAETITRTGNTLTLTTASQTLLANTSYEVSLLFYATKEHLSDTYTTLPAEESEISIQTTQTLPDADQNATTSYVAAEGIHYIDVPRYGMGYNNCGTVEQLQNIDVALQNTSATDKRVRLCFRQIPNVNAAGFNSLLCNNNGDPSGFPLQVSKNWHNGTTQLFSGSWIREYTEILVPANSTLNFDYTRTGAKWGETYSASSHQLSVVGSDVSKGGWLEAALGSFGENITHSPDYQFGNSNICDYRPFLVTNEAYQGTSQECFWTGNVGGMDMWVYVDDNNQRIHQSQVKTKFQRYSPNLTETSISAYSSNNKLKLDYTFYLNRSDDYMRVYYKIKIKALEDTPFTRFDIFQMGGDVYNVYKAQSVYYGNAEGIEGQYAPTNDGANNYTNSATALTGIHPWIWAGNGKFTNGYGGVNLDTNNGLIIRDYKAHLGGTTNNTPYFRERSSSLGYAKKSGENPTSYCLVFPPNITSFSAGDSIEMILETVILPKQDGDYYGPNTNFSNALSTHGNSVDLFLRECQGNKIELTSSTNTVNEIYPYSIHTNDNTATFTMSGGKGYVPIVFKGLDNVSNPSLWRATNNSWERVDQSTWGKDFWQADFQAETGLFDLVYNVNQDISNDAKATITYYLGTTPPTLEIVPQSQRN